MAAPVLQLITKGLKYGHQLANISIPLFPSLSFPNSLVELRMSMSLAVLGLRPSRIRLAEWRSAMERRGYQRIREGQRRRTEEMFGFSAPVVGAALTAPQANVNRGTIEAGERIRITSLVLCWRRPGQCPRNSAVSHLGRPGRSCRRRRTCRRTPAARRARARPRQPRSRHRRTEA